MSSAFDKAEINIVMPKSNNIDENVFITSIGKSKSGAVVSFDDGEGGSPVKDLTLDIESVQDLHGYDHPWAGGAGKNLYDDSQALLSGYLTSTGSVSGTGSASNKHSYKIPIVGGETYTYSVSLSYSSNERYCCFYDSGDTFISSVGLVRNTTSITFTAPSNASSISLTIYNADGQKVQLEKGSTATAWTPYENICPISGWDEVNVTDCGKNLFPPIVEGTALGITATVNDDGSVTLNGTANGNATFRPSANFVLKAGRYILSGNTDYPNTAIYLNGISGSTDTGNGSTIRLTEDTVIDPVVQVYSGKTVNSTLYPMIRLASEDSTFEPYNGTTYPINLGQTVYGGTLDVTTGVLTVTHGVVDKNNVTKNFVSVNDNILWVMAWDAKQTVSDTKSAISNVLESVTYNDVFNGTKQNGICQNSQGRLYAYIPSVTDESSCNAWLANNADFIAVYELATPQTYQLTPTEVKTLFGKNHIWSDSGDAEVTYGLTKELIVKIQLLL